MEHRRARVGWVGLDGMLSGLEHHMKGFKGGIFSVKFLTRRRTNYVFRPKTLCLGQFLTDFYSFRFVAEQLYGQKVNWIFPWLGFLCRSYALV